MIGAPPGYVGYEEGGQLTERVRRRPHSVILLDEIEKAHPEVFNVLLQLFDEGRLTDGQGRTVDFRNAVVIMTSNLGSQHMDEPEARMRELMKDALKQAFRPELLNRIDEVLVFRRLTEKELVKIAEIQFKQLANRLLERGITLSLSEKAKEWLAERGYDPAFGARPLKRLLQKEIENPLARRLLSGDLGEGDRVTVNLSGDGNFTFDK
jgi:ATP-dependent Clp protease ATP-binding subunit ClpB